uniref:Immunoglobulin subtype domain-containing protein n=1 Tax=Sinocyclocheilus grahami TaxID=75366 RepID=A0A672LRZ8_SINGR
MVSIDSTILIMMKDELSVCFSSDEISVKVGEELKLDVLLTNTKKVVHQNKISKEWTVVWKRRGGVRSDRLIVRDGNLTINEFKARDAGTYRVLDFDDEILITMTVTGERSSVDV